MTLKNIQGVILFHLFQTAGSLVKAFSECLYYVADQMTDIEAD